MKAKEKTMRRIFCQTKTQYENIGDVLINKTLLSLLREKGKITAFCGGGLPESFFEEMELEKDERSYAKSQKGFVKEIISSAIKAKKDGDEVYLFSGLGAQSAVGILSAARIFVSGLMFMLFRIFGVRIVKIGASVEKYSKSAEAAEKFRSLFISEYFVRDSVSLDKCKRMNIKKARLCPDMSWSYMKNTERVKKEAQGVVAVTFRSHGDDILLKDNCTKALEMLEGVIGKEMKVIFYHQVEGQKSDEGVSKYLFEELKSRFSCTLEEKQLSLSTAGDVYKKADFVLSNRLHALLLGYKYGAVPLALINKKDNMKIYSTFTDCGIGDFIIDTADENFSAAESTAEKREQSFERIVKIESEKREEIEKIINEIFDK